MYVYLSACLPACLPVRPPTSNSQTKNLPNKLVLRYTKLERLARENTLDYLVNEVS
jgi:hypothetical protein